MRTLLLLRHGKSSWSDSTLADADRPLTKRGERACERMAAYMRRERVRPDLVLCSPTLRTRQTLATIEPSLTKKTTIEIMPDLYTGSEHELLDLLRALPDPVASVLLIGHNPALQELALSLASNGADLGRLREKFPTAALATLQVDVDSWTALALGQAKLVGYVRPRRLR